MDFYHGSGAGMLQHIKKSYIEIKMENETKMITKDLYDALLDYLIQSSASLDETGRALAPDPVHAARVKVLNKSLDSAKVILSMVLFPRSYYLKISSPAFCNGKSREEILAGSTEETMRSLYSRKQRASINDPPSIGDIPEEVLRKAFIYLLPGESDLVAPSETCRAFRPVAQELMHASQKFYGRRQAELYICGTQLKTLVSGLKCVAVNRLEIDMESVGIENLDLLLKLVGTRISSLRLDFPVSKEDDEPTTSSFECYATLGDVFLHCCRIRNLTMGGFNFGDGPGAYSVVIKGGFSRLKSFDLSRCGGNLPLFINQTPIPHLQTISIYSNEDEDVEFKIVEVCF